MPPPEAVPFRNWLADYARHYIGHVRHKSKSLLLLSFNILTRPRSTGAKVVTDDGAAGLLHAIKYYSKMFALAFAIFLIAARFKFYDGDSEWRTLLIILVQFIIALTIIYVLCLCLPNRPSLLRLIQAALYVDGVFIVCLAAISIPISYLDMTLNIPTADHVLDIFATEYERCLSDHSTAYWLLRGDLQFFLYSDIWKAKTWVNWLLANYLYVLILPFLGVFASILRAPTRRDFILICIITGIAFISANECTDFIKRRLSFELAARDTKCRFGYLDQVVSRYSSNLIAQQVAYKINNDSLRSNQFFAPLSSSGKDLVLNAGLKSNITPSREVFTKLASAIRQAYCADNAYWRAARRINSVLFVNVHGQGGALLDQQVIRANDCP